MKSILIKENGEIETIFTSKTISLQELQKNVDGYIEWVTINTNNNTGYYVNEEGKLTKGMNEIATKWWYWNLINETGTLKGFSDFISGDVVYLGIDDEGENCELSDEEIEKFEQFVLIYKTTKEKEETN
jgi:hypothetical protein